MVLEKGELILILIYIHIVRKLIGTIDKSVFTAVDNLTSKSLHATCGKLVLRLKQVQYIETLK